MIEPREPFAHELEALDGDIIAKIQLIERLRRAHADPIYLLFEDRVGEPRDEAEFEVWVGACHQLTAAGYTREQITIAPYAYDGLGLTDEAEPTPPVILERARSWLDIVRLERIICEQFREYEQP